MKKKKKKILNCVLKIGIEHVPKTICISIFEKLITTPLAFFFFFLSNKRLSRGKKFLLHFIFNQSKTDILNLYGDVYVTKFKMPKFSIPFLYFWGKIGLGCKDKSC